MNLTELIKGNFVHFSRYKKGFFYMEIHCKQDGSVYEFPVPVADIGDGTVESHDKAILYMKWIKKAIEDKTLINTFQYNEKTTV